MERKDIYTFYEVSDNYDLFFKQVFTASQNYLVFKNEQGQDCLLLMIRPATDKAFPNELCPFGGGHKKKLSMLELTKPKEKRVYTIESDCEAAEREAREESGIRKSRPKSYTSMCNPRGTKVNITYSNITLSDLINIKRQESEVAVICSIPVSKLRECAVSAVEIVYDGQYNEKIHTDRVKEEGGLKVSNPITEVSVSDLTIHAGETDLKTVKFRPQAFILLDNAQQPIFSR